MMILSLGIGTQIATVTTVVTTVTDSSQFLYRYRTLVTVFISVGGFLLGLPLCLSSGMYLLQVSSLYYTVSPVTC